MTTAGSAVGRAHVRWLSAQLILVVIGAGVGCGGGDAGTPAGSGGRGSGGVQSSGGAPGSGGGGVDATGGGGPGTGGADFTGGAPGGGGAGSGGSGAGTGGSGTGGSTGSGGAAGTGTGSGGMGPGGGGGSVTGTGGMGGARPGLSFTPADGIYSVALSITTTGVTKMLTLHNGGAASVMVTGLTVTGAQATRFMVDGGPTLPASVPANGDLPVPVKFLPPTSGGTTVYSATLTATASGATAAIATAGLYGLAMSTSNAEASLDQIVKTLGYNVNVGGTGLTLGTSSALIGDEIAAKRFVKAAGAPSVGFQPMARYSPFEAANYGYYTGTTAAVERHPLGTMSKGPQDNVANRTLFPPLDAGAMLTFDPGTVSFGFFAESPSNASYLGTDARLYQEDALNNDQGGVLPVHRFRVYPLKNRAGQAVAGSFLVVCEEASNSDYQDYVFVLSNAAVSPN